MISAERVEELLMRLPQLTIGLLGDLFLDQYLEISSHLKEDSIETGLESYRCSMYVPYLTHAYDPKDENSKTPLYTRIFDRALKLKSWWLG